MMIRRTGRALTLHLLRDNHISPPGHANGLVKQDGREDTVRSNNVQLLHRLVCDGGNASIRDVAGHIASSWIRDVVHRSKHARNLSSNRIASANTLRILENTTKGHLVSA